MTDNELGILQGALDWATVDNSKYQRGEESEWNQSAWCGTGYCIAGKMCLDAGWQMFEHSVPIDKYGHFSSLSNQYTWADYTCFVANNNVYRRVSSVARDLLGLEYVAGLFSPANSLSALWSIGQVLAEGRLIVPEHIELSFHVMEDTRHELRNNV